MVHDAKRRIRGRDSGPTVNAKPETPLRDGRPGLGTGVLVSAAIHALVLAAIVFIPGLLPSFEKPAKVFTVTMANLPPGPKGGGGQESEPVKPEPKPVTEPKRKEPEPEPVKIAAKTPVKPEQKKEPEREPEPVKPVAPIGPGLGPVGGGKPGEMAEGPVVLEGGQGLDLGPYSRVIESKVRRNWKQPVIVSRNKPRVTVFFRIDSRGYISGIKTEISSGVAMVDRLAESAVKNSNPLPPLPRELDVDSIGVHYTFVVSD